MTLSATMVDAGAPSRLDRAFFDRATFPNTLNMPVRFDDLDVLWHVNNGSVITFLQEARIAFTRELGSPPAPEGIRSVVGGITVEYAAEINFPGSVEIASGVLRVGRTSYTVAQRIRQNGQSAVYAFVTMVISGPDGATPIYDSLREAIMKRGLVTN